MKTTINNQFESESVNDRAALDNLIRRVEQLEQEKVQCGLAAQESLRRCETKYQTMLESVDAHITLVDRNLVILWANDKAKKIFGPDIIGKSCCKALYGKKGLCCDTASCLTRQAFHNGSAVKRHSMKMRARNGKDMHFDGTARVVSWDEDGKPAIVVKIYKDITERKLAEEELRKSMKQLRKNLDCTIQAIARTVETRDAYTAGHQRRTTDLMTAIAFEMGLPKQMIDGIRMAGVIHDLGKISVPAEILSKPGKISDSEYSLIKQHPKAGYEILKGIDFKWPIADIVLQHHERLNGSGYPYGLKGEEILMEARIIGVADVIEAMASHRPYRPALGIDDAFEEITMKRGIMYDAEVVDASIDLFTKRGYQIN